MQEASGSQQQGVSSPRLAVPARQPSALLSRRWKRSGRGALPNPMQEASESQQHGVSWPSLAPPPQQPSAPLPRRLNRSAREVRPSLMQEASGSQQQGVSSPRLAAPGGPTNQRAVRSQLQQPRPGRPGPEAAQHPAKTPTSRRCKAPLHGSPPLSPQTPPQHPLFAEPLQAKHPLAEPPPFRHQRVLLQLRGMPAAVMLQVQALPLLPMVRSGKSRAACPWRPRRQVRKALQALQAAAHQRLRL
mmetsp:Transcript_84741/g.273937  ORF Transcript_84741/g.273937 Transcript_84741/m.273937 type:complete len:245 (-) Transcript_84741:588-1322(-)